MIHQQGQVGVERLADTLAVIPGFHVGQGLQVRLDPVGDAQQGIRTLGGRGPAPGVRRRMCRIEGDMQVRRRGAGYFTIFLTGYRCDIFEIVALQGGNPLAPDKILITALEGKKGVFVAGHGV